MTSLTIKDFDTAMNLGATNKGAVSKLVKAWETELSDVRTATAMSAPALADLALTLHRLGGATREAGVTVFETLIDIDAYGARDTLLEVDGRFRPQPLATRTRLRRRS